MAPDDGSIRWHRGGWEISWYDAAKRRFKRLRAPNTRAGRRAAEAELERLSAATGEQTVADIIEDYRTVKWAGWSPSTRRNWPGSAKPILTSFGAKPAAALTAADIERTYAQWRRDGLTVGTIRRRHTVLSAAMVRAERLGVVAHAVTRRVELPKAPDEAPAELPDVTSVLVALRALESPRWLAVAARLTVATGMRRGELVALRWTDVDLDAGCLWVRASTSLDENDVARRKATKSKRASAAESLDLGTLEVLRAWQGECQAAAKQLGVRWAASWPVFGADDPSSSIDPHRVTRAWVHHRSKLGLDHVRWHDLRHINASELVAAGVDPVTIAARLGHNPTMLLGRYAHARPAGDQVAADVIDAAAKRAANGG